MTRLEAISHVLYLESSLSQQFCCSTEEFERAEQETHAALRALGVSEAEIVEARK